MDDSKETCWWANLYSCLEYFLSFMTIIVLKESLVLYSGQQTNALAIWSFVYWHNDIYHTTWISWRKRLSIYITDDYSRGKDRRVMPIDATHWISGQNLSRSRFRSCGWFSEALLLLGTVLATLSRLNPANNCNSPLYYQRISRGKKEVYRWHVCPFTYNYWLN